MGIFKHLFFRHCIPIGLHANLSEGSPVCPALKEESSLLNQEGFFHGKMGIRTVLAEGLLKMSEVGARKIYIHLRHPFQTAERRYHMCLTHVL